jgi:hypothetical protein
MVDLKNRPLTARGMFACAAIISEASEDIRTAFDLCSVPLLQELADQLDSLAGHLIRSAIGDEAATR